MHTERKYDAFISYNKKDFDEIDQIVKWYKLNTDLNFWFDKEEIVLGDEFRKKIENSLELSNSCIIFFGKHDLGKYQDREVSIAINKSDQEDNFRVIPVVLPEADPNKLPGSLSNLDYLKINKKDSHDNWPLLTLAFSILGRSFTKSSNLSGENEVLSGSVLYANIMGYSNLDRDIQEKSIDWIVGEIEFFAETTNIKWIDLKEGEFLIFIDQGSQFGRVTMTKVFLFGLQIQFKCVDKDFKIGTTLHWEGDGNWRKIINDSYLIGNAFSEAKRYMAFSGNDHFFLSSVAFDKLKVNDSGWIEELVHQLQAIISESTKSWPFLFKRLNSMQNESIKYEFTPFTYYDRHKRDNALFNFHLDPNSLAVGNSTLPNQTVDVEFREKQKIGPHHKFVLRLAQASTVTLLGLTHETTLEILENALNIRKEFWEKLQVIFPSENSLENVIEEDRSKSERKEKWLEARTDIYRFLLTHSIDENKIWECLEYEGNLPFGGDKSSIGGIESIRVQFVLPGFDMKDVFHIEVFQDTRAFNPLSKTIDIIIGNCTRLIEWTLYGMSENKPFRFEGLFNRKDFLRKVQQYPNKVTFPVVLIMMYIKDFDGNKLILQERTISNASSDLGKYSNLSGRLIDRDYFEGQGIRPPEEYLNEFYSLDFAEKDNADFIISEKFKDLTKENDIMSEKTWEKAALREIKEELGLMISANNLVHHGDFSFKRPKKGYTQFYRIYSYCLVQSGNIDEWADIKKNRPNAKLERKSLKDLKVLLAEDKLNDFLHVKYDSVFLKLFKDLEIAE